MTDHIVREARERLDAWRRLPFPDAIRPSPLWETHTKTVLAPVIDGLDELTGTVACRLRRAAGATARGESTSPGDTSMFLTL